MKHAAKNGLKQLNLSFVHSSRKAWGLLRKLGGATPPSPNTAKIHPNRVARRIVRMSKMPSDKKFSRAVIREYRTLRKMTPKYSSFSDAFTLDEINLALAQSKTGKAAGEDGVYMEFLINAGTNVRNWLAKFLTNVMTSNILPTAFKRAKIIALLKPGKPTENADSYRPVALLSVVLKLFERLIYNRIEDTIQQSIPPEQAGFRAGRSCTDQVLCLTNFIETGYQKRLKTGVVFVDLTAAYDTVWKKGLLLKLLRIIPCLTICDLLCNMLSDRMFHVYLNNKRSSQMKLNDGIPQGSVLAPLLFNLYIHDLPSSTARKFLYADDSAYAVQGRDILWIEQTLKSDMASLMKYCQNWRLNPSVTKTETSLFHLDNRLAKTELKVTMGDRILNHNPTPKYLGVTLDRSLTFKQHITKLRGKINSRNNIICKLASTSWGTDAKTLRISTLSLVFSTANYCCPVWVNSCHSHIVDAALNKALRIVSGTVRSTPTTWLPVLANIAPPHLQRRKALLREYNKAMADQSQPLFTDLQDQVPTRLKSRKPPLRTAAELAYDGFSLNEAWCDEWRENGLISPLFTWGSDRDDEFTLPRREWANLNRLRTKHGRCGQMMHKWRITEDASCPCGYPIQTTDHIMLECELSKFDGLVEEIAQLTPKARTWLRGLQL